MALLVAMVLAAAAGLLLRYLLPHRETYGALLTAGVCASVTAVVWSALLVFANLTADIVWLWLISIAAGLVAAAIVPFVAGSTRPKKDRALLESLAATKPL